MGYSALRDDHETLRITGGRIFLKGYLIEVQVGRDSVVVNLDCQFDNT